MAAVCRSRDVAVMVNSTQSDFSVVTKTSSRWFHKSPQQAMRWYLSRRIWQGAQTAMYPPYEYAGSIYDVGRTSQRDLVERALFAGNHDASGDVILTLNIGATGAKCLVQSETATTY